MFHLGTKFPGQTRITICSTVSRKATFLVENQNLTYRSPGAFYQRLGEIEDNRQLLADDVWHDRLETVSNSPDHEMLIEHNAERKDLQEEESLHWHHVLVDPLDALPSVVRLESPVVKRQLHHDVQRVEDRLFFDDIDDDVCFVKMPTNFLLKIKLVGAGLNKHFFFMIILYFVVLNLILIMLFNEMHCVLSYSNSAIRRLKGQGIDRL